MLVGRLPEQRLVVAAGAMDGQRRERDQRQREVDGEHGARNPRDRPRNVARRIAGLLREVGDRLDAGVRDHRNRDREQELAPRRCDSPVEVRREDDVRMENEREPDQHEQELRREVHDGQKDVQARRFLDPDDVEQDEHGDDDCSADDVPRVLPERAPEDREVVGHEERRDGDRDDVIQHLRPGRTE